MAAFFQYFLHLDQFLPGLAAQYGAWIYAILFAIVFAETGLVVTPFLPGDSLIFAAGAVSAIGVVDPIFVSGTLFVAAVLGNTSNYWIGRWCGPKIFHSQKVRWLNRQALDETHQYFDRYGAMTIVLARFIPIVRTLAPFVAGVGAMRHGRFQAYSVSSGFVWVAIFFSLGYFFGNLEFVHRNLSLLMVAIIVISVAPMGIGWLRRRRLRLP